MKKRFLTMLVYMIGLLASLLLLYVLFASLFFELVGVILILIYFSMTYFSLRYLFKKRIDDISKLIYMTQFNIMLISSLILIKETYAVASFGACIAIYLLEDSNKKKVSESDLMTKSNLLIGFASLVPVALIIILVYSGVVG